MEDVTAKFAELMAKPADLVPLDEAVLLIAAHDHEVDRAGELARLDRIGAACRTADLDGVRDFLFKAMYFSGDADDYHHPDNSFLDRVIERRKGLPILLCILTAEVAARVGVCLAPVGLPGHFMLRDCSDETVFVDPYNGGMLLDADACKQIYERLHPGQPFRDDYLEPIDNLAVLVRVLTNLVSTYSQRGPISSLAWALHLRAQVVGGEAWPHAARVDERTGNWERAAVAWEHAGDQPRADATRARAN